MNVTKCDKCGNEKEVDYTVVIRNNKDSSAENFSDVCKECVEKIKAVGVKKTRKPRAKKEAANV